MPPETIELIELIEAERERTRQLLDEADEKVRHSGEVSKELSRDLEKSDVETKEALKTLRRSGLLSAA
jgi:hypothetical protein